MIFWFFFIRTVSDGGWHDVLLCGEVVGMVNGGDVVGMVIGGDVVGMPLAVTWLAW